MSENIRCRLAGGQNPLILVPVRVDAKGPYQFILDTGASHCLLSQDLAATLGIQPEIEKQAMGAGGPVKLTFGHVTSITIGSALQENVQVAITNEIQRIGAAIQNKVDGVVGFAFLKEFVVVIDYRDGALRLALPSGEGLSHRGRLLVVSYTERADRIRLISARLATRNERKQYEEAG